MEFVRISKQDDMVFEGSNLWSPFPGYPAFGGQIAAQSLVSALSTVAGDAVPIALSILFVSRCLPSLATRYVVRSLRSGNVLDMRSVECYQGDTLVSTMHASFSRPDCNIHDYESEKYELYEDEFIPFTEYISRALNENGGNPAEIKVKYQVLYENMLMMLNVIDVEVGKANGDMRQIRIRVKERPTDTTGMASLVTLISDLLLVETALITSNLTLFSEDLSLLTSVDHVIHFVDLEKDVKDFVYYVVKCKGIRNSKAICEGQLIHEDGTLICLTRQQGVFRVKRTYSKGE